MNAGGNTVTGRMKRYDPDEQITCPKCGQDSWNASWAVPVPDLAAAFPDLPPEWLILSCWRCKYEVFRLPLDAPDAEQGEQAE